MAALVGKSTRPVWSTVSGCCKCGSAWLSRLHNQEAIREECLALPLSARLPENEDAAAMMSAVAAAPNWPQARPPSREFQLWLVRPVPPAGFVRYPIGRGNPVVGADCGDGRQKSFIKMHEAPSTRGLCAI